MIEAKVVLDSISEHGKRITTFKCKYPKFIHGEFMTHRVISRNASSSRAIPTAKLLAEVRGDETRATFVHWGADQKGMGTSTELANFERIAVQETWRNAALSAADAAEYMLSMGAAKQLVNRLLEPFSHINVVATATEWDNFFGLRLDKAAQPEMRALAIAMWEARKASDPDQLPSECWHLPFVEAEDYQAMGEEDGFFCSGDPTTWNPIKVSVARCARVSYESFETGRRSTVEEDIKLYDRLVGAQPLHASPAEHQATPDQLYKGGEFTGYKNGNYQHPELHGNFRGWKQFRQMLDGQAVAPIPEEFR